MRIVQAKKIIPLLLVTLVTITGVRSQDSLTFTLHEAQQYAVEHSVTAENARLEIENAKEVIKETRAIGLPQVSAELSYQYIIEQPEAPEESPFDPIIGASAYIDNYLALADQNYERQFTQQSSADNTLSFFNDQSLNLKATISQLIFSGEYIVALQASKGYLELSENDYEKSVLDIKQSVASSYFSIKTFEESVANLDSMVLNLKTMWNDMKAMSEQGLIESTDADQIELTLKNIENQRTTLNRQKEVMYKMLKIQMGLPTESEITLKENLKQLIESNDIDKISKVDFDIMQNISYKMINTQENLNELSLKREKSAYLPTVSGFYQYSQNNYLGEEPPAFETNIPQMVGVSVSLPIFTSGSRNAKVQQAKISLEQTRNSKHEAEESIKMSVLQAQYDVNNALDKYYTSQYSLNLSKRIMKNTNAKYKQGMASSMDISQANNQYLEAFTSYTQAMMQLLTAKITLNKLVNNL